MQLAVPALSHPALGLFWFVQDPSGLWIAQYCTWGAGYSGWTVTCKHHKALF